MHYFSGSAHCNVHCNGYTWPRKHPKIPPVAAPHWPSHLWFKVACLSRLPHRLTSEHQQQTFATTTAPPSESTGGVATKQPFVLPNPLLLEQTCPYASSRMRLYPAFISALCLFEPTTYSQPHTRHAGRLSSPDTEERSRLSLVPGTANIASQIFSDASTLDDTGASAMAALALGSATGPGKYQRSYSVQKLSQLTILTIAKLDAVTKLVDKLTTDMDSLSMAPKERNDALEELKIYGRDPRNADPIFTQKGISMLLTFAFNDKASSDTSRGALRVLANSMVLKPETRQMFVDGGYAAKACQRLNTESWDDEFLLARIIFLSTYSESIKISPLVTEHGLADSVNANLGRHAKLDSPTGQAAAGPMEEMALPETLKLLFNITYHCPGDASAFTPSVPHIVSLLFNRTMPSTRVLDPPLGPLVNSLLNLDLAAESSKSSLFPSADETSLTSKLVEILERAMQEYPSTELDATVTPVVDMLSKMYTLGPELVQKKIRDDLLPTSEDRQNVLGKGTSLSARLLKASTNPMAPKFGSVISHFFFLMSDRDASKFVENVGYGYASGYLFQNNVPMPASANATFDAADDTGSQRPVNPITGQFIDKEKPDDLPPMTDEEKEREAERLFVLFERLKMNGVLSVQNPVEQAVREGKFRELKDDEVEELD
ncbi:hypothetical protein PWT90_04541 [Aphanocladium album]|nr:hypothetical protein PWT90_04541 [Aphanocladium album]